VPDALAPRPSNPAPQRDARAPDYDATTVRVPDSQEPSSRAAQPSRPAPVLLLCVNGASLLPFLSPTITLHETDASMAPLPTVPSPWQTLSLPPALYKRVAELSPILPYPSSPLSLALLAHQYTARRRRLLFVAGVHRSPQFIAGATHSPSVVRSRALLFTRSKPRRVLVVSRTNPRLKTTQIKFVYFIKYF
jgi:hypothetical protein